MVPCLAGVASHDIETLTCAQVARFMLLDTAKNPKLLWSVHDEY